MAPSQEELAANGMMEAVSCRGRWLLLLSFKAEDGFRREQEVSDL